MAAEPSGRSLVVARAARLFARPRALATLVTRFHAFLLRASRGRLRRSWLFALGQPVMSLTTTGRRSGRPRTTAVAYFRDGEAIVTTAANLGSERDPAWALNLEANPDALVVIGGERLHMTARRAKGAERERLWGRWVELQGDAARATQAIAGREVPVFVLALPDGDDGRQRSRS